MDDLRTLPVFPLPEVVLFPKVILTLNVFEPRYLTLVKHLSQMDQDNQQIVIAKMKDTINPSGLHDFEEIGTIGKLIDIRPAEGGRFNIVLYGQEIVRMKEVDSPFPYRLVEILDSYQEFWPGHPSNLILAQEKLFKSLNEFAKRARVELDMFDEIPLNDLINGLSFSLNISSKDKQQLLEKVNLQERLDGLVDIIDTLGYYIKYVPDKDMYSPKN